MASKKMTKIFKERKTVEQVEEGYELAPKFDEKGLMPVVTTDAKTGDVLMLGYQNEEAVKMTIETGEAYYWSRSRECLWHKGATSGLIQKVIDIRIDDDQDAIWLKVELKGLEASCHVGYKSCFYRSIPTGNIKEDIKLIYKEDKKAFEPEEVYGDAPNPTKL
jgi:phosphoribosyl-AMP cyclohydrolase